MARCAQHHWRKSALVSFVVVSILALGIMAPAVGLRHTIADSIGCVVVNGVITQVAPVITVNNGTFDAGDVVSVTASEPSTGSPTAVQILVNGSLVDSAAYPVPGTVSFLIPTTGVINQLQFGVDVGTATLDIACAPAPPTPTPTDIPAESATVVPPTETATAVPPPPPLLTISKVADKNTINAGDPIGFTITITSTGNGDATSVFLLDPLGGILPSQPGTTETSWTESTGNQFCFISPADFGCQFGTIASGAPPITLHLTAPTTDQDCGTVENTVRLDVEDSITVVSASVTINCPTSTPAVTSTAEPTETALPTTEVPTETAAATATSETTGGVSELPSTGGDTSTGSGDKELWLLVALLAVVGAGITALRARRWR